MALLRHRLKSCQERRRKFYRFAFESLEPRLTFNHDGSNPLAAVEMYANAPEIVGVLAAGPLTPFSVSPLTQNFTYTTQANGLPILNSLPGAPAAIYFDIDGDTNWGGVQPYDVDGNIDNFNTTEQQTILENWWELSMYFSMFNINVTTIKPTVPFAWVSWGANPTTEAGLSQVDVFPNDTNGGSLSVAGGGFGFRIGDTLSHEVGHNFGAWHGSSYNTLGERTAEYSVPLDPLHVVNMGAGSSTGITRWIWGHSSLGGEVDPTRLQDDMALIAADVNAVDGSGDGYRPDDYAATIAAATPLTVSGVTQAATGVIERLTDGDMFSFTSTGGRYSIVVGRDYPSGVDVKISIFNSSGQLIASEDGDPRKIPYTMVNDAHLALDLSAGTYFVLVESHGNYGDQGQYVVRVDPMASGWQTDDIGIVRLPGYDSFNSGVYTLAGAGLDIAGTNDEFHYLYQALTGNGSITVRLDSMTNTNTNAKSGIMIRDSLDANASNITLIARPTTITSLQYRSSTGGATSVTAGPGTANFKWMRLTRNGNNFTAEVSQNGTSWTLIQTRTITMGSTVLIGMVSLSRNVVALNEAKFSNVSLTGTLNSTGFSQNPLLSAPGSLTLSNVTSSSVSLTWTKSQLLGDTNDDGKVDITDYNNVKNNFGGTGLGDTNGDGVINIVDYNNVKNNFGIINGSPTGYIIERSIDGVNFSQIGTSSLSDLTFSSSSLSDAQRYFYRVRGSNSAGASQPSPVAAAVTRAGAVSNLRILSYAATGLVLDWTDAGGETSYRVERSANGTDGWTSVGTALKNQPLFTNSTGLSANTQYFYRVVSLDSAGDSTTSNVVNAFTRLATPAISFTTKASNQMVIGWSAITGATGYRVERSLDNISWSTVSSNQAATSYTDNSVIALGKYFYRVTALSATNSSATSSTIFAAAPAATALPSPWTSQDIGAVGGTGAAGLTGGTLTVVSGGADIWGSSDQFRYTYISMSGNGSITARVVSLEDTNFYARAGVMIRNTTTGTNTAANSRQVSMMVHQSDASVRNQYRSTTGGATGETNFASIVHAPYWVRLTRTGNSFKGETSADGVTWVTVDTRSITMNTTVLIGLAVTPRDNNYLNKAVFDNVSVTTSTGTIVLTASSGSLVASASPASSQASSAAVPSSTISLPKATQEADSGVSLSTLRFNSVLPIEKSTSSLPIVKIGTQQPLIATGLKNIGAVGYDRVTLEHSVDSLWQLLDQAKRNEKSTTIRRSLESIFAPFALQDEKFSL